MSGSPLVEQVQIHAGHACSATHVPARIAAALEHSEVISLGGRGSMLLGCGEC